MEKSGNLLFLEIILDGLWFLCYNIEKWKGELNMSAEKILDFVEKRAELKVVQGGKPEHPYAKRGKVGRTQTMTALTLDEIELMKSQFYADFLGAKTEIKKQQKARNLLMFTIAINTGMRGSDVTTLQWEDVFDFNGKVRTQALVKQRKTRYNVDLVLNEAVQEALLVYVLLFDIDVVNNRMGYIFESQKGNQITRRQMEDVFKECAEKVKLSKSVATHTGRKTFARQYIERNRDNIDALIGLSKALGHKDLAATMSYAGFDTELFADTVMAMNL